MMMLRAPDACGGVWTVRTQDADETPVSVKAALVDPASMAVMWTNDPTATAPAGDVDGGRKALSVEDVVPLASDLGVPAALSSVAETGVARHLQTDVVSTRRGSVALRVSVYRLPGGMLLVLAENAWQVRHRDAPGGTSGRAGPRGR